MIKGKNILLGCLLLMIDGIAYFISLGLAYVLRDMLFPVLFNSGVSNLFPLSHYLYQIWWCPLLMAIIFLTKGLYTRRFVIWDEIKNLMTALFLTFLLFQAIVALGKFSLIVSRSLYTIMFMLSFFIFPLLRYLGKTLLYRMDIWSKKVIVVGTGSDIQVLAKGLCREQSLGFKIEGFIAVGKDKQTKPISIGDLTIPVLGHFENLESVLKTGQIDSVVLPIAALPQQDLGKTLDHLQSKYGDFYVVPELAGISVLNSEANHLFPEEFYLLKIKNNLISLPNKILKRVFDLLLLTILILPLTLIILILALCVFLETRSNPFYIDIRWGKGGKKFSVYKLRSMHKNGDEILKSFLLNHPDKQEEWKRFKKIKGNDPRLTHMGKILRKFSLDELPQIYNVLLGTMSFVGPRPYLPKERADIGDYLDLILSVKPGMTGLWQISGRNELEFSQRLRFDYLYIKNWSLWLDFMILVKTTGVVLGGKGSY